MKNDIIIHWFRQDLRIADNPSLAAAAKQGTVLPIFILDEKNAQEYQMGAASRWWLHYSLIALNKSLKGKLSIYKGDPKKILIELIKKHNVKAVHWNRCYEPWRMTRDAQITKALEAHHVAFESFNSSLLWEPWENLKADGTPYKKFTPFYNKGCLLAAPPRVPIPKPLRLKLYDKTANGCSIESLALLPKNSWGEKIRTALEYW